ncbi:MAG: hypothetical protein EI684_04525 [Candidatus Viridilinea halotolerans]|uniref:Uncharacterized protein n=1 Tax=Candidatus Viridilinea halotolerans TaxID=2491704 RepID=A0A426U642_9CHLR|nr:MAG: hypothetical protein EI684_04525 [Candidatus Viridilinea halotolerans]
MTLPADDEEQAPYRPPDYAARIDDRRVCPDCRNDPVHGSEGGWRPVSAFRLVTGKAAARYKDGRRYAAYCRHHENQRMREGIAAKRAAGIMPTDAQRERQRASNRRSDAKRRRTNKRREAEQRWKAKTSLEHQAAIRDRAHARYRDWAARPENREHRKAYRARWYREKVEREKVEREIAAGLHPSPSPSGGAKPESGNTRERENARTPDH